MRVTRKMRGSKVKLECDGLSTDTIPSFLAQKRLKIMIRHIYLSAVGVPTVWKER